MNDSMRHLDNTSFRQAKPRLPPTPEGWEGEVMSVSVTYRHHLNRHQPAEAPSKFLFFRVICRETPCSTDRCPHLPNTHATVVVGDVNGAKQQAGQALAFAVGGGERVCTPPR